MRSGAELCPWGSYLFHHCTQPQIPPLPPPPCLAGLDPGPEGLHPGEHTSCGGALSEARPGRRTTPAMSAIHSGPPGAATACWRCAGVCVNCVHANAVVVVCATCAGRAPPGRHLALAVPL